MLFHESHLGHFVVWVCLLWLVCYTHLVVVSLACPEVRVELVAAPGVLLVVVLAEVTATTEAVAMVHQRSAVVFDAVLHLTRVVPRPRTASILYFDTRGRTVVACLLDVEVHEKRTSTGLSLPKATTLCCSKNAP